MVALVSPAVFLLAFRTVVNLLGFFSRGLELKLSLEATEPSELMSSECNI
jgi:hypothetical protein